jgi:hypothetical protein
MRLRFHLAHRSRPESSAARFTETRESDESANDAADRGCRSQTVFKAGLCARIDRVVLPLAMALALAESACGHGMPSPALFQGLAAAAQLAPLGVALGARVAQRSACDGARQPGAEMTFDEARDRVLAMINVVRAANHSAPLGMDSALTAFAQDGAEQLARDHRAHGHIADQVASCPGCGEVQSSADGFPPAAATQQIDGILQAMVREGPGGTNYEALVDPRWHWLGIGIVNDEGPMYLTVDVAR